MSTITWQFVVSAMSARCPGVFQTGNLSDNHHHLPQVGYACPRAPRPQIIPLDTPVITLRPSSPTPPELYPIQLADITNSQKIEMENIILTSPIHMHTPTAHVGLICRGVNGQPVNARDIVVEIQKLAYRSLDYTMFAQFSGETKNLLKEAFMQRCRNPSDAATSWDTFIAGEYTTTGPIGLDLLLGCSGIWGLEPVSFEGYSVVHLA